MLIKLLILLLLALTAFVVYRALAGCQAGKGGLLCKVWHVAV